MVFRPHFSLRFPAFPDPGGRNHKNGGPLFCENPGTLPVCRIEGVYGLQKVPKWAQVEGRSVPGSDWSCGMGEKRAVLKEGVLGRQASAFMIYGGTPSLIPDPHPHHLSAKAGGTPPFPPIWVLFPVDCRRERPHQNKTGKGGSPPSSLSERGDYPPMIPAPRPMLRVEPFAGREGDPPPYPEGGGGGRSYEEEGVPPALPDLRRPYPPQCMGVPPPLSAPGPRELPHFWKMPENPAGLLFS